MIRTHRNPLVRRLRRHSNLATLFRLPATELEQRPTRQSHFEQAGPKPGLPLSKAFLPSTLPEEQADEISTAPPANPLPDLTLPEPKIQKATNLPVRPLQRARTEASPAPTTSSGQTAADAQEWRRLQAIVRKHRDKEVSPDESAQSPAQPADTLQRKAVPTQSALATPVEHKADTSETQTQDVQASESQAPTTGPLLRPVPAGSSTPAVEVQRSTTNQPSPGPVALNQKTAQPESEDVRGSTQDIASIKPAPDDAQTPQIEGKARELPAPRMTSPASQAIAAVAGPAVDNLPAESPLSRTGETGGERPEVTLKHEANVSHDESGLETLRPSSSSRQVLPLQEAWPVQASSLDTRQEIAPGDDWLNSEAAVETEGFHSRANASYSDETTRPATPSLQASETVQTALQRVKTGQPSESSIELIPPRKPRPNSPIQAERESASEAQPSPGETRSQIGPLQRQVDPGLQAGGSDRTTPISTEIGPLPSDLWGLIGEASPDQPGFPPEAINPAGANRRADHRPEESLAEEASSRGIPTWMASQELTAPPEIARPPSTATASRQAYPPVTGASAAPVVQRQPEAASAPSPEAPAGKTGEAASTQATGPDVDELARQVYTEVRRRFALEWERLRRRL